MVPTAGPRSFCTACGPAWTPVYQAGVVYGSKRHLVAISHTAKELRCARNIPRVQRAKNCLSIMTSYIGPNGRECQNTVHLIQPPAILSGCLQCMKKLEIYYIPVPLAGTCKYVRKKQLGKGWQRATNPESVEETRKAAAAHLPVQGSEPPGEAFGSHLQVGGGGGGSS